MSSNKEEKRFKVVKKNYNNAASSTTTNKGAVKGSTQSIYATAPSSLKIENSSESEKDATRKAHQIAQGTNDLMEQGQDGWYRGTSSSASASETKEKQAQSIPAHQLRQSRSGLSLSKRLGMNEVREASQAEPLPSPATDGSPSGKESKHLAYSKMQSPNRNQFPQTPLIGQQSTPLFQSPLDARLSPPETPLKHAGRGASNSADLGATPDNENSAYRAANKTSRVGGLLLQGEGDSSVFPKELQTAKRNPSALDAMSSQYRKNPIGSQMQIDAMLNKLKLARSTAGSAAGSTAGSTAGPAAGTQQSRWAVKEADIPSQTVKESTSAQMPSSETRKVQKSVEEEKAEPSTESVVTTSPADTLLKRISMAPVEQKPESAKGKKDRKRGGKKAQTNHIPTNKGLAGEEAVEGPLQTKISSSAIATHSPDSLVTSPNHTDDKSSTSNSLFEHKTPPLDIPPSTSVASISTNNTTEGSTTGNDTWGTINWADDDDDDLPDLPEEWMRAASLALEDGTKGVPPASDAEARQTRETSYPHHIEGINVQRGARRGGRGRGKKDRQVTPTMQFSLGIKIAGSAAQASREAAKQQPPKELFPMHRQENAPRVKTAPPSREQRLHGRPKLISSNKEAFNRLTKGALGAAPTPVSATSPTQTPARK